MNLPELFKQNQIATYSPNFHLELVCSSFHEFLSQKTPTLYQNINNQKQAYLFLAPTNLKLNGNELTLSSGLILNFHNFENEAFSHLRIISNNFEDLKQHLTPAGYQTKQPKGFVEATFENIITKNLTSFRLEKELSWEKSQIENLAYTEIYSPELELQATSDTQPLEHAINNYFKSQKNLLPQNIQKLLK